MGLCFSFSIITHQTARTQTVVETYLCACKHPQSRIQWAPCNRCYDNLEGDSSIHHPLKSWWSKQGLDYRGGCTGSSSRATYNPLIGLLLGYNCINISDICIVLGKINVEIDEQQWWRNNIMNQTKWGKNMLWTFERKLDKLRLNNGKNKLQKRKIELTSGCTASISLSLLRPYIIYAKLNLLLFLLSLAHPLSYLFIDLSSKALL